MSAPKLMIQTTSVVFWLKPTESDGFEQILDFLNANPIKYALTVNPTIYTSCIEQFWATAKVKTINGEVLLQALVDGKKVIINETSVRRDLQLEDAEGIECLPNADIFEQLALMGVGKGFYRAITPLFPTMMVQAQEEMGEERIADEATNEETVPKQSNDPPLSRVNTLGSGEDRLKIRLILKMDPLDHLAQALAELKECKNLIYSTESVQSTNTTAPSTISQAKGIVFLNKSNRLHQLFSSKQPTQNLLSSFKPKEDGTRKRIANREEIQKLFDKAMTRVNMFVDKDTELVKESSKKAEEEMAQESSSKRVGEELEQVVAKKQKIEDDKEKEDLK
ncbi:hypothetical protein Tco_0299870 [Tanacetum coccineum]